MWWKPAVSCHQKHVGATVSLRESGGVQRLVKYVGLRRFGSDDSYSAGYDASVPAAEMIRKN